MVLQETGCIIHLNTIHVLHVDDDTTFLDVSKQILSLKEEIEVEHATSAQEAFQKLSQQEFDVIISDFDMPQQNGLEFLKEVRKQNSGIPFILFTGKGREEIVIEALNLGADGYVNKHGNPETVYGELVYFIKQALKRKSYQKALSESQTKLKENEKLCKFITENTKDVIWTMNLEGKFTFVSPSVQKLRGYSPEEVMNQTILEALTPQSAQIIFEGMQQVNQTGAIPDRFFELEQPCKDGSTVWTEVNFTVIKNKNGEPETVLGISRDISERKISEIEKQKDVEEKETLLKAVIESETVIADALEKISETNLKLEKVNEKLKVVGGLTRHDVANKLTVASSNLYILKKRVKDQPDLLQLIEQAEASILESNRIFEFSRLYEQIGAEKLTKIVVSEVFDEAVKLFPNLEAEIINETQGLTVNADAMLRQLFYNLLENSIRYGKGFTQVKLTKTADEKQVNLIYEDNGVGITKENKEKIFSEGFTTGGTGLGLKLVKKMIESYGWSIREEGIPNKGAKFVIQMPN